MCLRNNNHIEWWFKKISNDKLLKHLQFIYPCRQKHHYTEFVMRNNASLLLGSVNINWSHNFTDR